MQQSKFTFAQWMIALSAEAIHKYKRGYRLTNPAGKMINELHILKAGEEIEISGDGAQTFGSGGFSASIVFAGNEPEILFSQNEKTGFTDQDHHIIRMKPGTIIIRSWSDCIGNDGRSSRTVYVCEDDLK